MIVTIEFSLTPCCVQFARDEVFCNVWAGNYGTIARIHKSEIIYVWGLNASGQLGQFSTCGEYFRQVRQLIRTDVYSRMPMRLFSEIGGATLE